MPAKSMQNLQIVSCCIRNAWQIGVYDTAQEGRNDGYADDKKSDDFAPDFNAAYLKADRLKHGFHALTGLRDRDCRVGRKLTQFHQRLQRFVGFFRKVI